ncbi:MAG: HD domain-containing protein [Deltaproteobacteria bacterium]|nr:HD domain-containing protein [Deltaproteobacteria bacterium]
MGAYRNHVYRVLNYLLLLAPEQSGDADLWHIAAAFHDLGIWTDGTFDYLEPSRRLARNYLGAKGLAHFVPEVEAIITHHHKLSPYRGVFSSTVEPFRQADLVDVSLGTIRFGISPAWVCAVKAEFPNAGFHRRLIALTCRQFLCNPVHPLPMVRW